MGRWPTVVMWIAALVVAGWAIDRTLVACELRGWILYRLTPRPRHEMRRAAGSMLIGVDGLFRPAARHVAPVSERPCEPFRCDKNPAGAVEWGAACQN